MDRRRRKTKKQIRESFINLIEEIGLKKITVSTLAKDADINRGTFYLHYKDIDDLLEKLQREIIEDLQQETKNLDPNEIIDDQDKLYPLLVRIIESFADHADLITVLMSSQGDPSFLITWEQIVANLVLKKFDEVPDKKKYSPVPSNYLATMIASIYTSIIIRWIETGMNETPEEIASIINQGAIQPIIQYNLPEKNEERLPFSD